MSSGSSESGLKGLGQAQRQRRPNFGWSAALLIVGSSPFIAIIGTVAVVSLYWLPAKFMQPAETLGYYLGIAIMVGYAASILIGLPALAIMYRAGFSRGFLAFGGAILHTAGWTILSISALREMGAIAALILDVILSAACIVVLWRRRRAMRAAEEQLLSRFD